ncbi:DUF4169 family protein [Sphingobium sp. AN558]|uniref:DUF4169 family protein n=1 Tax=Sphingobium sp. AN558 TaxID=3133442 RepID=UPI0030C2F8A5
MGDLINLRRARKAKARQDRLSVAQANRLKFGRTKAQKQAEAADAARLNAHIDGARRDGATDIQAQED